MAESELSGQNEAVYIAMQPGEMEGQVEVQDCQEVVIVAEGGDDDDGSQEAMQFGESQVVAVGAQEVYEEAFVALPKEEKPSYKLSQSSKYSSNRYSYPSYSNTSFDFSTPTMDWGDFSEYPYGSPRKYRPGGGKSLSKLRRIESSILSSDEESEGSGNDYIPEPLMLKHKHPKRREFAHRLQWRNRDMLEAMKAVEEQKMTIRGAAKKHSVPYSTLKDRVHGRVRHGAKPGVKTILSPEEEEELAKFVRDMENAGFQLRCVDVRDRAAELLRLNHGHNSPYKDGSPGHNWFHGFVKRHPGLEFKRTVKRNIVPSISKQKHMLRRFYDISAAIYKRNKLSHKADRIYSVSELRISGQFEATILYAAAANGSLIPPFVVFKGSSLKLLAARQEFPDAFFTCSYDGRVNEDIFLWWFRDHFLKKVPSSSNKPAILFISRGVHDITMQLVQLAKEEKMHLVGMAFGISHLVQPLDDDVSDMIRDAFNKRFKKWQDEDPGQSVTQKVVAAILRKVWNKVNPEEIAAKFTANGIYPLNAYAITQDKLLTGAHILREMVERSPPRPEPRNRGSAGFSGLNLLSALSSHEYASMDVMTSRDAHSDVGYDVASSLATSATTHGGYYADDHSLDASGLGSSSAAAPEEDVDDEYPNYKTLVKRQHGSEEVVMVPLNETSESGVVEQVEVESSELLETELVHEDIVQPTEEQLEQLMQQQREMTRRRPRPSVDVLRQTDVTKELTASRDTQQISAAVDSILGGRQDDVDHDDVSAEDSAAAAEHQQHVTAASLVSMPMMNIKQEPSIATNAAMMTSSVSDATSVYAAATTSHNNVIMKREPADDGISMTSTPAPVSTMATLAAPPSEPATPTMMTRRRQASSSSAATTPNSTVIRIAPDRIKDEISRAIQSGSFSKTNTLKLSDFHGNDIKIQIRIRNPDEMRNASGEAADKTGSNVVGSVASATTTASSGSTIKRPRIVPMSRYAGGAAAASTSASASSTMASSSSQPIKYHRILTSGAAPVRSSASAVTSLSGGSGGGFIKVASPGSGTRNIVIQSSQIRARSSPGSASQQQVVAETNEFTPIMKVEKVQESLPSQFLAADDDAMTTTVQTTPTSSADGVGDVIQETELQQVPLTDVVTTMEQQVPATDVVTTTIEQQVPAADVVTTTIEEQVPAGGADGMVVMSETGEEYLVPVEGETSVVEETV